MVQWDISLASSLPKENEAVALKHRPHLYTLLKHNFIFYANTTLSSFCEMVMEGHPMMALNHGLQKSETRTLPSKPPTETGKDSTVEQAQGFIKSSCPLKVWAKIYSKRVTQDWALSNWRSLLKQTQTDTQMVSKVDLEQNYSVALRGWQPCHNVQG